MWVLRYQYSLDDGSVEKISCCIRNEETYYLGRSSKNQLSVRNDKSISRQQISIQWDRDKDCIMVKNLGKVTMVEERYLSDGETLSFQSKNDLVTMKIGTTPIVVNLSWEVKRCNYMKTDMDMVHLLQSYGFQPTTIENSHSLDMIIQNDVTTISDKYLKCYSMIHDTILINSKTLRDILTNNIIMTKKFDSYWVKLNSHESNIQNHTINVTKLAKSLKGMHMFLLDPESYNCEYFEKFLEEIGCIPRKFLNINDLETYLETQFKGGEFLLLSSAKLENQSRLERFISIPLESFLDKLLFLDLDFGQSINRSKEESKNVIEPVLKEVGVEQTTEAVPISKNVEIYEPQPKKRRLNRSRVKPLDSLNFFAGGVTSIGASQLPLPVEEANNITRKKDKEVIKSQGKGEINIETEMDESGNGELLSTASEFKKPKSDVQHKLEKRMQVAIDRSPEKIKKPKLEENISIQQLLSNKVKSTSDTSSVLIETQIAKESNTKAIEYGKVRQKTLTDYKHTSDERIERPSVDLVHAIQDIKERETLRVKTSIVEIKENELTEEAINKFSDLTVVDINTRLFKDKSLDINKPANSNQNNMDWSGKKNFKKFVKMVPKYKRSQGNGQHADSCSTFIRNSAMLITRNFVPMKQYSKLDNNSNSNEMTDFSNIEVNKKPVEKNREAYSSDDSVDEPSFTFTRNSSSKQLFVMDESINEDSLNMINDKGLQEMSQNSIANSNFEVPNYKDRGNKSSDSSSGKEYMTKSSYTSFNYNRENSNGQVEKNSSGVHKIGIDQNSEVINNNDDDDDDDDEDMPKFRFRKNR
ncbi:hypothetical protein Kpol_1016p5 [Vanderwaltozyma polyspora DSM 70294]|uniref:FHA domain-containing protein n=1 Tax=Vanderwaltozyma polyspora (strain ATCC 22028 / DSM 70294 / BCRC 21397 / CBS 2163 / NBRC 10782 / NRRL Y-8283 / UCD 57-17) TaxID=436907 RepID=A7TNS3_VANPO|nr:uncharacterized protein Kpol_1016p5 [Vanderwaltozyma polyspora DSM 70294]EDO16066.1 hypothetical protein Kpol_1016p5 [Vanderwaltozyma polyspora DSM 70294]